VALVVAAACVDALVVPLAVGSTTAGATSPVASRPSSGCALAAPVPPGTTDNLLAAGGDQGAYVREVPRSYNGKTPMPVIFDLHGYAEPATLQASLTALGTYGESHGFITITPQVAGPVPSWVTTLGSKDLAFFGGLLRTVDSTLCVDRNRTYVTGYSNGAMMASSIACQYAGQIAAVAPVAGIEDPAECHPSRPVPVVTFHGTADQFVSYNGGLGPAALNLPASNGSKETLGQQIGSGAAETSGPSVPQRTATWAHRNGCRSKPTQRAVASDVTLISYTCPSGNDVELYRIKGGGHAWPGSVASKAITSVIGRVTFSISADQIIWTFFQAHPLRR
jgi:polyhydroxybutyrate depolymerase